MTSFGWKRKAGANVSKTKSTAFKKEAKDSDDEQIESGERDWLSLVPAPKKMCLVLEDHRIKSERLKREGSFLAEQERYWEALKTWDEAIKFTPNDEKIYEMKAQALLLLNELYPAITMAQKVIETSPTWWVGHQTLGRVHLGLGEVRIAIKCFSKAIFLNPAEEELWEEDLKWALDLLEKKRDLEKERLETVNSSVKIKEINEEGFPSTSPAYGPSDDSSQQSVVQKTGAVLSSDILKTDSEDSVTLGANTLKQLPQNYVVMRD